MLAPHRGAAKVAVHRATKHLSNCFTLRSTFSLFYCFLAISLKITNLSESRPLACLVTSRLNKLPSRLQARLSLTTSFLRVSVFGRH